MPGFYVIISFVEFVFFVNIFILSKTKQGVKNLALLIKNKNIDKENKLYKTYDNIKSWHSIWIINFSLYILLRLIVRNLKSSNPNIKMFDLFKLKHLLNYFS